MNEMRIVMLGPPGGGKGSQAQRLAPDLGVPHISTGDMLRTAIREGTPVGLAAKAIIDRGELVPDDVMLDIIKERFAQADCQKGFILDGFPRTIAQADALEGLRPVTHVINLIVSDDVIVKRLSGRRSCKNNHTSHISWMDDPDKCPVCGEAVFQRDDDKPETVKNRLEVYRKNTAPLIGYYRDKGILRDIEGDVTVEEANRAIHEALE